MMMRGPALLVSALAGITSSIAIAGGGNLAVSILATTGDSFALH